MDKQTADSALVREGWVCFLGPLAAWPISALTWAREEPQTVLGLSWIAIVLSGGTVLLQAITKRGVDEAE